MIVFFVGLILMIGLTIFWRKCTEPRLTKFMCLIFLIIGLIPIINIIGFLIGIGVISFNFADKDCKLKENKFTKFWFD